MSIRHFTRGLLDESLVSLAESLLVRPPAPTIRTILEALDHLDFTNHEPEAELPQDLLNKLYDLGIFSLVIPQTLGGLGAHMQDFCRVVSRLAVSDTSAAVTVVPHSGMGVKSLLLFGSEPQQHEILQDLARKRHLVAFALTEAEAGSDVGNHNAVLNPDGPEHFLLNADKIWITNAAWAGAIVVCAKCPQLSRIPGGSVFVLVKPDDPGVHISQPYNKMGLFGSVTCQVQCVQVRLPADRLMGRPGMGVQQFNQLVDTGRMGVAAGALGLIRRMNAAVSPEDGDLVEFAVEAALGCASIAHEKGFADAALYTALIKVLATRSCLDLARVSLERNPEHYFRTGLLARLIRDVPVLRITEGPNEVLRYRTGVDLAMARNRNPQGVHALTPLLNEACKGPAGVWDDMLQSFEAFCAGLEQKYDRFLHRQYVLDRLVEAALELWVGQCALLSTNALISTDRDADRELFFTERLINRCAENLERIGNAEKQNRDELMDQSFSAQCH